MAEEQWLTPRSVEPLSGAEEIGAATVEDFWRWAFSDLRENVLRGVLAEYLVAKAVGDSNPMRRAWDNHDATTSGGTRIEVKSAAYLQSWRQKSFSKIVFSRLNGRAYSYETNQLDAERSMRADLYVFALHTCQVPEEFDPLDLDCWRFYVVSVDQLRDAGEPRSVSLPFLERMGIEPVGYADLGTRIGV